MGNAPPSFQNRLRLAIDTALAKRPTDWAAFLSCMEQAGYESKTVRGGGMSFRLAGQSQQNFTRLRASTLGEGYDMEDIMAVIHGRRNHPFQGAEKVNLLVDIQAKLTEGKGPGYERWAKVFNLKQMAAALAYLQDNDLTEYGQLEKRATRAAVLFHDLSDQIKQTEAALHANMELKAVTVQYAKTRPVFENYKATKYSREFLSEHEADIKLYRAAQADLKRLLGGAKLPKMGQLIAEGKKLMQRKQKLYGQYQMTRHDMREVTAAKANIDYLLGNAEQKTRKEQER